MLGCGLNLVSPPVMQKDLCSLHLSYPALSDFVTSTSDYLTPSLEHNNFDRCLSSCQEGECLITDMGQKALVVENGTSVGWVYVIKETGDIEQQEGSHVFHG